MPGAPNDRKDPRDANPMFKRLPAEVVSRRKQVQVMNNDDDEAVNLDRKAVFALKPELRAKWLSKALRQAVEGKLRPGDLFDVVASSRFVENLTPKVGRKMGRALRDQVNLFTSKQQKFLIEQAEIVTRFGVLQEEQPKDEDKSRDKAKTSAIDEMMARVNAFVSAKQSENLGGDAVGVTAATDFATTAHQETNGATVEQAKLAADDRESKQDEEAKDKKAKKEKDAKGKEEKKDGKDSKVGTKSKSGTNGKSTKRHSSSSSRSRSKSRKRRRKARKDDKGGKKATSKKAAKSSESSSSGKERRKHSDKKKKRDSSSSSSSSSSESSSKNRRKNKKKKS